MRLDRFLTLAVFQPLQRVRPQPGRFRLPILMYHSISDDPEPSRSSYYKVCTSPARFARQMRWLKDNGYRALTLSAGLAWLKDSTSRPPLDGPDRQKVVLITFDDGFRDFHTIANPILRQHGFEATMFLPTGFIGEQPRQFLSRDCLTWSEVRELHCAGVEFGSHTVSHPRLVDLDWPGIERELRESKAVLEDRLGGPVRAFAYPYAFPQSRKPFVQRFRELLAGAGYESCVTTGIGRAGSNDDFFALRRLPVNDADDSTLLAAKLDGAYDWLAWPQRTVKSLKTLARR